MEERRLDLWTLYRLLKLGIRPSDFLEMREDGYSSRMRQALDLMALEFGEAFERARDATQLVDAPPSSRKPKAQVPIPVYSPEQLLAFLGVETTELDPMTQAAVTADMFEGLGLEE